MKGKHPNIYMDYRTCCKCKNSADVVEGSKDYCASCYFVHVIGMPIEEYEKKLKERYENKT
tara:strand:+ start:38 stop:220 length:183 start_codon:yes stop_codon:yes gene_type:complete